MTLPFSPTLQLNLLVYSIFCNIKALSEDYTLIFLNVRILNFIPLRESHSLLLALLPVIARPVMDRHYTITMSLSRTRLSTLESLSTPSPTIKNVSYRISQAVTASKLLTPLSAHKSLPPSWKLTVYRSVIQSILLYAMESAQLSPSQLTRINHVHFKSLRRIFG